MESESWTAAWVLVGVALAVLVALFVRTRHRHVVEQHSVALAELRRLNGEYVARLQYLPPADFHYAEAAVTKAKFDQYDLRPLMLKQVMLHKPEVYGAIDARMASWASYLEYCRRFEQTRTAHFGSSSSEKQRSTRFVRIEMQQFRKQKLAAPAFAVHVRCDVTFTTTQGQVTYTRSLDWSLSELINGLYELRRDQSSWSASA